MKRTILAIAALLMAASYSDAQETQQDTTQTSIFSVVEVLDEAVATAEKSRVVYRLDRQKVSGNANLSASGGTAVDVLKSIPSVQVNADGELSYRGSTGFLVYVDGRQSVLEGTQALQQISAANIEDVEIITTPSARYKTDGDVGIINIITRKQDEAGFSGSVNASGSTIGSWNGDALMNLRKGSNRWYLGLTAAQQKGRSDFLQDRKAVVDEYVTESLSDGERFSCNSSYIARIGYELNLRSHRLLFEAQTGVTEVARGGDLKYDEYRTFADQLINDALYDSKDRYSNEKRLAQLSADYDWKINDRGDNLSFRSRFRYDWYALEYTESNMFDEAGARYEGTRGYEDEAHWDIDVALAYDLHYRKSGKAEFGYQMTSYSEFGDYSIKYWNREVKDFQWQDHLAAPFWYRRQLHSLYAMVTDKFGPVSLEAGVRGEHTNDKMHFEHTYTSRDIKRWNLFPSAHISYEAPGRNIISAGYSYRVARPGIWELEPYITYEDYYTKKTGNPDIRPEYIHSAEIGYRKHFGGENVMSFTGFFRRRSDVRERIRTAYTQEPGVTLDSLVNSGNDRTIGLEASATVKPVHWWRIVANASVYHYRFDSTYEGGTDASIVSSGFSMMNNFNVGRSTRLQFDANYVGPRIISQGKEKGYVYFDLAIRQPLMKNRLAASLVFHDMFRTAKYYSSRISPTLTSETFVRPKYPHVVLSLTYNFNSTGHKEKTGAVSSGAMFEGKDF
ncbi:MAG: TonB-dependent receptor [Bacteroidales bacterium]|nr:TonB-dependent receptor [Bacteroidales bacterium]